MNIRNKFMDIGGAAGVATDLIHKKAKVAKELMEYFIRYYRKNGAVMMVLYPFRADIYRKMGFGLGTEIREYRIKPSEFPKGSSKSKLFYMDIWILQQNNIKIVHLTEKCNLLYRMS